MKHIYFISILTTAVYAMAISSAMAQRATPYLVEYQTTKVNKDFRLSIGGGYAFRLGKVAKTGNAPLDEMNKKLRHGFSLDADAQYFFKENWGIGLNANLCSTNASASNVTIPGIDQTVNYSEKQRFIYVGASFIGRNELDKFLLISSIGVGPIFFNADMNLSGKNLVGTKTTLGLNAGIVGEYKLNNKMGLGIKLSYVIGSINNLNIGGHNVKSDEKISVSNLMATTFISFRSW